MHTRPHHCYECSKGFGDMPTLQTHIQMFHGENPTNVHNAVKCFQSSKTVLMAKKILNFIPKEYML